MYREYQSANTNSLCRSGWHRRLLPRKSDSDSSLMDRFHVGKEYFFAWKVVKCSCKDNAIATWLFLVLLGFVLVFHEGQLTVSDLFLWSVKRPGRTRRWWMMPKCFLLLIQKMDHIGGYWEKPLLKTCHFGPSGLLKMFTCVSEVSLVSMSVHWLIYESVSAKNNPKIKRHTCGLLLDQCLQSAC